ncbi:YolD-like family protein [Fodinisporobacter ferrooxydans]|uniref:YolD-like family protein n=1 Tax=Fodinisporobacter ferrooxydans TaxID=2901836 RepID=A0ABY4CGS0_9BACL|nr:YolD-like family protein [Alicyclobacillaceae bacterium MYW30-H2]
MRVIEGNIFAGMRMIIPEHREAMQKLEQKEKRLVKPTIDEQKLEEVSRVLAEAMQEQRKVTVQVFKPFGVEEVQMVPTKVDSYMRQLKGIGSGDQAISLALTDIVDAWL